MEKEKNNSGLIALVIVLFLLVLGLGGYIVYDKVLSNKETPTNNTDNEINENTNTSDTNIVENTDVSVRTYRFFGYTTNGSPDMYTTLKLYSDGTYTLYLNNCEGVTKYSGNFTETDTDISLLGEITKLINNDTFKKKSNGNTLEFDFSKIACNDSGGSFSLESYMLGE